MQQKLIKIVPDATTRYQISRSKIYSLIADGTLEPVYIGRSVRLNVDKSDAALGAKAA